MHDLQGETAKRRTAVGKLSFTWRNVVFIIIALAVIAADQLTKLWIRTHLAEGEALFSLGIFHVVRVHNTGAAFGLFRDYNSILVIIRMLGVVALLIYGLFYARRIAWTAGGWPTTAIGLVLGGTVGNLIDNLRLGYVTDFIDFTYWPAFNVADSCVSVGVTMFVIIVLLSTRTRN